MTTDNDMKEATIRKLMNAYEGGCLRESTLYKICTYYDNQYGTKYTEYVEKLLDRKLNPDGKWVE